MPLYGYTVDDIYSHKQAPKKFGRMHASVKTTFLILAASAAVAAAVWGWSEQHSQEFKNQEFLKDIPREDSSKGYVTSDRCQACHPQEYDSWYKTYHRTMTQWARPETVRADFENVSLHLGDKSYNLSRKGDEFHVELENPDEDNPTTPQPRVTRRIGMLTGSHHMQVFWIPSIPGNMQVGLPFAYLLNDRRWVPTDDTLLRDPKLPRTNNFWNFTCLECHTTSANPGVTRGHSPLTGQPEVGMDTRLGEMGIGCESCHGPGREHAHKNTNPVRRYDLAFSKTGDSTIVNPARLPAKAASETCAQCHSAHGYDRQQFFEDGLGFRPGTDLAKSIAVTQPTHVKDSPALAEALKRDPGMLSGTFWPDGKIRVSGRDYNGLIESPCYQKGELSCLSCHSMHHSSPTNQLRASMDGNQACLQCHSQQQSNLVQHTHHAANSSGSLCYNCHMPYTTYGLMKAIRSHTIDSPNVATTVSTGRPNACNLCHLDKSLGWTDDHLTQWYGKQPATMTEDHRTVSSSVLLALKGDAGQRALIAWAMGWAPAREASGESWLAPYLAEALDDPYSAVRYIAGHSLGRIQGFENFKYDFIAPPSERRQARSAVLQQWTRNSKSQRRGPEVLIEDDGELAMEKLRAFLEQRDERSIDLKE